MGLKAMTELADLKAELDLWDRMARQAPSAPRVPTAHKASQAPKATKVTKVTLAPLVSVDLQAKKARTELQAKMEALVDQAIAVLLVSKAPVEGLVQEVSPAPRATTAVRALQVNTRFGRMIVLCSVLHLNVFSDSVFRFSRCSWCPRQEWR